MSAERAERLAHEERNQEANQWGVEKMLRVEAAAQRREKVKERLEMMK